MNTKTIQESLMRLLVDVDSQRLTPAEAAKKINQLYASKTRGCENNQGACVREMSSPVPVSVK